MPLRGCLDSRRVRGMKTTANIRTLRNANKALFGSLSTADRAVACEVLAYARAHHRLGLVAQHPDLFAFGAVIFNTAQDCAFGWRVHASSWDAARTIIALVANAARAAGVAA